MAAGVVEGTPYRFLLNRRVSGQQRGVGKLTRFDVEEIRRFARAEGFALSAKEQVAALQESGFAFAEPTLYDVLRNRSWYDPEYDHTSPLPTPSTGEAASGGFPVWWLVLLMLLRAQLGRKA